MPVKAFYGMKRYLLSFNLLWGNFEKSSLLMDNVHGNVTKLLNRVMFIWKKLNFLFLCSIVLNNFLESENKNVNWIIWISGLNDIRVSMLSWFFIISNFNWDVVYNQYYNLRVYYAVSTFIKDLSGLRNELVNLDLFVTSNRFKDIVAKMKNLPTKSPWMYLGVWANESLNDAIFIEFKLFLLLQRKNNISM